MKRFSRKVCDCCGTVNPPTVAATRITTCCIAKGGMYRVGSRTGTGYGSNGKVTTEYFQFPIEFKWVGFWSWFGIPKKPTVIKKRCPKCNKKMKVKSLEHHLSVKCKKRDIIPVEWCDL